MMKKFRTFIKKHQNLNLILSGVALVYIWRGVWSLTDMFTFGTYIPSHFWSYFIPMIISFSYIYLNDYKMSELVHIKD
jgi:hypothetical protein